ncbi:MAG: hypothetical protein H6Q33_3495 [Deltaproteobacteria bacterium]|nr:hypothetical protein [Deltaproteobacteria bacterium]
MIAAHCSGRLLPQQQRSVGESGTARHYVRLCIGLLLTLPLWMPTAHASSLVHNDVVRLANTADVVALGVCVSSESAWDAQHRFIETTIRFQPTRSFKGVAAGPLTIKVLGGQIGTEGMTVSHSTTMAVREEAVLFLQRSRFGAYFVVAGGPNGKLPVQRDPHTGRRLIRGTLSLDDFEQLITRGAR